MTTFTTLKALLDSPLLYLILAMIVAAVVGVLKTYVEALPWFSPTSRLHDSTIQGLTLLLGFGAALWWAYAANLNTGHGLLALVNGFIIGLSAMGGYSALAKRLGFGGLSQGAGTTDLPLPIQRLQTNLASAHGKLDEVLRRLPRGGSRSYDTMRPGPNEPLQPRPNDPAQVTPTPLVQQASDMPTGRVNTPPNDTNA